MGEALGNADADAVGEADGVFGAETVRCKVVSAPMPLGVVSVSVRSVRDGGSGGPVGTAFWSSRSMEIRTARVIPASAAPRKSTGAKTAVSGKSTHGESPARVRPSRTYVAKALAARPAKSTHQGKYTLPTPLRALSPRSVVSRMPGSRLGRAREDTLGRGGCKMAT